MVRALRVGTGRLRRWECGAVSRRAGVGEAGEQGEPDQASPRSLGVHLPRERERERESGRGEVRWVNVIAAWSMFRTRCLLCGRLLRYKCMQDNRRQR